MRIIVFLLLALSMVAALADTRGPWIIALENVNPLAPRAVLVLEESVEGKLSAGTYLSIYDTKPTPVDVTKLTRKEKELKGDISLSKPAPKVGDPALKCVYTLDATLDKGAVTGNYTGTEDETKVEGKLGWGADRLPMGHPLFYPSAIRPVGFRGEQTNAYPGATMVPSFDERTEKNILWKVETPSWSNSGLVAVGDKLFTVGEPYSVFCYSAKDGKLLWQRELNPYAAAGLTGDKLKDATELYEVVAALRLVSYHMMSGNTPEKWEQAYTYIDKLKAIAAKWAPESSKGFDDLKVAYKEFQNGKNGGRTAGIEHSYGKCVKLLSPVNVPLTHVWYNMVGFTYATPVSDGKYIYTTMGQGQVGCFDLEGNMQWMRYFKPNERRQIELRVNHVPSPLLVDGLLIGQFESKLVALDARTGETKWEDAATAVGGGYNVGTHRVLRLAVPDKPLPMAVIVTTKGRVLRASDGKLLVNLGVKMCGSETGGSSPAGLDNIMVFEPGENSGGDWKGIELTATDADTVTAKELWTRKNGNFRNATIILPGKFIKAGINDGFTYDPRTGEKQHEFSRLFAPKDIQTGGEAGATSILVGDKLLLTHASGSGYNRGNAPDLKVWVNYATASVNGTILSPVNVLGGDNKPRYPIMEKYMPEWYAQLSAYHHEFLPTQFTFTHSGPVAVGDKIYTRSTSHLYCIGSSLAVSDEKEIAAIRAMTTIAELTPKLDSTSPALRQEAITRISTLGEAAKPAVEKLTAIVNNDAFGAVRAAAVLALNAIDPAGKPGTAALNSKVGTTFNEWTFDTEVAETLTALGETVGLPMVASLLTNKDPKIIGSAALAMSKAGWSSDASRDALLKAERLNPRHVSTALSTNWGDDPLVITAHRTMLLAMRGGRETAWTIFAHLLRVTPKAERTAFIIKVANGQSDVVDNALKELSALKPQPAEALDIYLAKGAANSTTALNILIGILASDAPAATRCRVAEAMGKSKPEAWVLTPLQKASADPDPTVAAAAKAAVAALEAKGKSK